MSAMTDVLDGVRDHYRASGLTERLKTALTAFGPDEQRLTPQQLATLDQFHTRGLAATVELAKLAGIATDMLVLDVGSGVGGPGRLLSSGKMSPGSRLHPPPARFPPIKPAGPPHPPGPERAHPYSTHTCHS